MDNSTVFALVVGEAFRFYGEFSSNRDQQILREQANALDTLDKFVLLPLQETEWRVKVMLRAVATSSLQPVLLSRAQQQFGSRLVHSKLANTTLGRSQVVSTRPALRWAASMAFTGSGASAN